MVHLGGGLGPIGVGDRRKRAEANFKEDRQPVRLLTRLNLAARGPATAGFRLVLMGDDGRESLVCLAQNEREIRRIARGVADRSAREACGLLVQRWVGTPLRGRWVTVDQDGDRGVS